MLHVAALALQLACGHVTVKSGDTLDSIAIRHEKSWPYVWRENAWIKNPNLIYPGQEITICDAPLDTVSQPVQTTSYPQVMHNEPCRSLEMWPQGSIHMWYIPIGCYGGIYYARSGYGDCFQWVNWLLSGRLYHQTATRVARATPGVAVYIPPGNQGAGPYGHWAYILSIRTQENGRWALISEENMYWRGGGYGKISYRYLLLTPDMLYYR